MLDTRSRLRARLETPLLRAVYKRNDFNTMTVDGASNIDRHVRFDGAVDVLRYVPRAAQIGLAAPFSASWVATGMSTGRAGRAVAGVETAVMYAVLLFAAAGIVRRRAEARVWLLASIAIGGMVALGRVVRNVGILFRMRYPSWLAAVILGVGELRSVIADAQAHARAAEPESVTVASV